MKRSLVLFTLVLVALCTEVPHLPPIESRKTLTYRVNLQDPPQVRWLPIYKDFSEPIHRFMQFIDLLPIPKGFYDGVEWWAKNQFKYQDFVTQIQALSKISACTGFLVRNASGTVMHGRNLDFQMWELLAKLLVNVQYYKGGKKLFAVDQVAGSVFALTGVRFGGFSINVDTRGAKSFQDDLISVIKNNAIPTCWLLRKVLEEETNYAAATKRLRTQRISAPVYYIVAGVGPNEGMVIERQTDGVHAYYELDQNTWFIVQTNYDRDAPEPIYDGRRVPMQKRVRARGNLNFTVDTVLQEMFTWPNYNIATIMTAVISPGLNYHNTTAWYGVNPTPSKLSVD